jgi:hypothetical protein
MDFEIYCDESRLELLALKPPCPDHYVLIGGLWVPASRRPVFKDEISAIRKKERCFGEIKWNAVAPSRLPFYLRLIDWFFDKGVELRFRCIVVERDKVNLVRYHESDQELGFYKFYYQLIHHWILDFNTYAIFLDLKSNRAKNRLRILETCLRRSNLSSDIRFVQALPSVQSPLIQVADLLIGAVGYKLHQGRSSSAKVAVVNQIEQRLGRPIRHTPKSESKFNIFRIELSGGW